MTSSGGPTAAQSHVRAEDLATCISCGLCLNDCPTYRVLEDEADSPRGRIQLIRLMVSTDEAPDADLAGHLDACLVCRACETACPSGVPFGRIMEGAREVLAERRAQGGVRGVLTKLGLATLADPRRLAFAARATDLYARSPIAAAVRRVAPAMLRWASSLAPRAITGVPVASANVTTFLTSSVVRGTTTTSGSRCWRRDQNEASYA